MVISPCLSLLLAHRNGVATWFSSSSQSKMTTALRSSGHCWHSSRMYFAVSSSAVSLNVFGLLIVLPKRKRAFLLEPIERPAVI